jgi:RND family efflux transporter MFP subunit
MNQLVSSTNKCFLILSGLLTWGILGCHSAPTKAEAATPGTVEESPVVETVALEKGRLSSSLQIPGQLNAYQQVDLYAKENGFVKNLYADVGSEVKAGQLLATLEAPELNAQLAAAESNLKSREAIYLASKANYDRLYETSKTPGTISGNDLDQANARKNSDFAQLEAAKATYRQILETKNYLQIRAPFSGIISSRNVHIGAIVGPSGKGSEYPLFTLQEQRRLRLVLSVPEAYTNYLSHNNEVSFTVRSLPDQLFRAQINRMSGAIDNRLRSEHIEMDVENKDKKLLPGMVAEVELPIPAQDSSFIVPKTAVVNSTESVFVIRVEKGQAVWVPVKTGREANGKMEVYGDLQPGDRIIRTATDEIRNGSEVKKVKEVKVS